MATKRPKKGDGLLVSFARTIGSTLGTVAAKTDALSKPAQRKVSKINKKSRSKPTKTRKKTKA